MTKTMQELLNEFGGELGGQFGKTIVRTMETIDDKRNAVLRQIDDNLKFLADSSYRVMSAKGQKMEPYKLYKIKTNQESGEKKAIIKLCFGVRRLELAEGVETITVPPEQVTSVLQALRDKVAAGDYDQVIEKISADISAARSSNQQQNK